MPERRDVEGLTVRARNILDYIGATREDGTIDWSIYQDPKRWANEERLRYVKRYPMPRALYSVAGCGPVTVGVLEAAYAAAMGQKAPETTEYGRPGNTLKVGFPPPGSPLLDLEVCHPDLLVGLIQTLARFSSILRIALHPDVERAFHAIEARLNAGATEEGGEPLEPLNLPFEEERQAGWLVDIAHLLDQHLEGHDG